MEDSEIILLFNQRDEEAIRRTQSRYSSYLMTIARNILGSDEDSSECVNDTYLKAWNTIPPNAPEKLSRYLGKITRELSIDRYRRRTSKKRGGTEYALSLDELEECVPSSGTPESSLDQRLLTEAITRYLRGISADARTAFVCRYYHCDPVKRIAEYHNMSESKVKSLLFRTRAGLKVYLEKEGFSV